MWRQSEIMDCTFTQSVIQASQFENCLLRANNLQGASVQLDTFRQCSFEDMTLGDCTFLNQLLIDCRYKQVKVAEESIGTLFGISEKDLLSFELIYLGRPVVEITAGGNLLEALEKDYEQRHWFFAREMLRLNFRRCSRAVALEGCLEALLWPASFGAPLKGGDITFLEMVVLELFRRKELPGISALGLPDRIKDFQPAALGDITNGDTLKLRQFASRLRGLLLEMLGDLESSIKTLAADSKDQKITARLVFERKPEADVVTFVRQAAIGSGLHVAGTTIILREERGSYIVVLQTTLFTLAGVQMALWLLNGCVAQLIELKSRTKIALQKRAPLVIRDRVLQPDQHIPKWMAGGIQAIFSKLTATPAFLGQTARDFAPENLRTIEITDLSKRTKRRRATPHKS
jgi:hypothetical protein